MIDGRTNCSGHEIKIDLEMHPDEGK